MLVGIRDCATKFEGEYWEQRFICCAQWMTTDTNVKRQLAYVVHAPSSYSMSDNEVIGRKVLFVTYL
jgi:hypothetical protein